MGKQRYSCSLCKKEFENGDLISTRGKDCLHRYSYNLSDDFDCDSAYALQMEIARAKIKPGSLKIFYDGKYYSPKEVLRLPNSKKLMVLTRNDSRGSKIEGNLERLAR